MTSSISLIAIETKVLSLRACVSASESLRMGSFVGGVGRRGRSGLGVGMVDEVGDVDGGRKNLGDVVGVGLDLSS